MSNKNRDVDRAIASVGGEEWVYHSFRPMIMVYGNPRENSMFAYNEFGEPQYTTGLQLPSPSLSSSPEDEYLEDAAYPETHPDETWHDIPAPENHIAVFIAPAAVVSAVVEPAPVAASSQPLPRPLIPSVSRTQPGPPVFAARQATAKSVDFVPFLPSALPQANGYVSAHPCSTSEQTTELYLPAERAAERPLERALERAFERPLERPLLQACVEPIVGEQTIVLSAAALPFVEAALSPSRLGTSLPIAPPMAPRPAYKPAPPQRATTMLPRLAGGMPYPQPFETLAETYARLARLPQETAAPPRLALQGDDDEQKMFRRL